MFRNRSFWCGKRRFSRNGGEDSQSVTLELSRETRAVVPVIACRATRERVDIAASIHVSCGLELVGTHVLVRPTTAPSTVIKAAVAEDVAYSGCLGHATRSFGRGIPP